MCFAIWDISKLNYKKRSSTGNFDVFLMKQMVSNRKTHHIYEYIY